MHATPERSSARSLIGLTALMVAYVLAFVDRQILNLLVEPIKRDLHLSDVGISLLQGLSFALFLSIGGLPIGRLVDTRSRTRLLGLGIGFWSLATAGCGLASSYIMLLACRIGVGVGEATMTPSAYSLIGDWFSARRQGLAMGIYSLGVYLGSGLALVAGGLVMKHVPQTVTVPSLGAMHGWQLAFLAVGLPGLLVALWVMLLREPARSGPAPEAPSWKEVRGWFAARALPLALVNASVACSAMAMYGLSAWLPAFLQRHYGMAPTESGPQLGLIVMIAGSLGTLLAGLCGDRMAAVRAEGRLMQLGVAAALAMPCAAALPFASKAQGSLLLAIPLVFLLTFAIGSGPATLQQVTPPRMRGLQHALAVFAVTLIGLGIGPTAVALTTDHILHDEARLGEALAIVVPLALGMSALAAAAAFKPYRALVARGVA
jgi:MFS family permease